MGERTLFARKTSGLVREIGFTTAVTLTVANVVGLGWQKRVFQAAGAAPVPSDEFLMGIHPMVMAFLCVGIVILLSIYAFAVLSAAMPRSGGGYVFITRILSPGFGFVATWMEFLSIAVSYGVIAVATFEAILIFGGIGPPALASFAVSLANPWFLTAFGIAVVLLFSALAMRGARLTGRLLRVLFVIPAVLLALVYVLFMAATPASMEAGVQALTGHGSLEYTQTAVDDQGLTSVGYWKSVGTAMLYGYWAYIGYAAVSFVAGEVKEAHRRLPRALFTSGIVIILIYLTISTLLVRSGSMIGQYRGFSFIDAVAWMGRGGGSFEEAGLPAVGTWMPIFAGIRAWGISPGVGQLVGLLLIFFGVLWVANDIPPFILSCSRMIFAMALDRVLPEKLANISEKWHAPINAIVVTSIAALLGVFAEAELFGPNGIWLGEKVHSVISSSGAIVATDMWDILFFIGVAIACALFPRRLPEVYDRSAYKQNRTAVQVLGWLAAAANLLMAYLVIKEGWGIWFDNPHALVEAPFLFSVSLILVGIGLYYWGRGRAARKGADMATIFTEVPPE